MPENACTLAAGIAEFRYRVSEAFSLVDFDSLDEKAAARFRFLREANPELSTLFVPRRDGLSMKAASPAAVTLLRHLDREGPTPLEATGVNERDVACLVLDGILEVETPDGWRSGPHAAPLFLAEVPDLRGANGASTEAASASALRIAEALPVRSPVGLARQLYRSNRKPASPQLRCRFPDDSTVARRLGLNSERTAVVTGRAAVRDIEVMHNEYWLRWRIRQRSPSSATPNARTVHKLYVSPGVADLRPALEATFRLFEDDAPPFAVKVGRGLAGILRSDKLVAYFWSEDELRRAAGQLRLRLDGLVPHPVPFTAQIGGDGLLSCGVDPPGAHVLGGWDHEAPSWRSWVTNRLGSALASVKAETERSADLSPARLALARLAVEGVDPHDWEPVVDLWGTLS